MRYNFRFIRITSLYPTTEKIAEQRVQNLIQKFKKDNVFRKDYIGFMNDIMVKGHAERVPEEQLIRNDGRLWYILQKRQVTL